MMKKFTLYTPAVQTAAVFQHWNVLLSHLMRKLTHEDLFLKNSCSHFQIIPLYQKKSSLQVLCLTALIWKSYIKQMWHFLWEKKPRCNNRWSGSALTASSSFCIQMFLFISTSFSPVKLNVLSSDVWRLRLPLLPACLISLLICSLFCSSAALSE